MWCHCCPSSQALSFLCWIIIRASQLLSLPLTQLPPGNQNFIQKYPSVDVILLFITFQWCYTQNESPISFAWLTGLCKVWTLATSLASSRYHPRPASHCSLNLSFWHFLPFTPKVPASSSCFLIFAACGNTQLQCDLLVGWLPRVGCSIFCILGIQYRVVSMSVGSRSYSLVSVPAWPLPRCVTVGKMNTHPPVPQFLHL